MILISFFLNCSNEIASDEENIQLKGYKRFTSTRKKIEKNRRGPPKEPLKEPLGEPLDGENIPLEETEKSTLKRKRSPVKSIENTIANKRERESSIPSKKSSSSTSAISSYNARLKKLCCWRLATALKYDFLLLPFDTFAISYRSNL